MLRYTVCFCSLLCLVITTCPVTIAHGDDFERLGWTRVWQDEFDQSTVNTGEWDVLNRRDSFNNEKQYYLDDQVSLFDGKLRLTATNVPLDGKAYRSGLVRTHEEWSYGRFEIRADLPTTQGMWPAIWLLPRTVNWPTGGEIDIMENRGSQPFLTSSAYHWQTDPNVPCCDQHRYSYSEYTATDALGAPVNFHEGFHDYAVEWEPNELRFYVDGNRHFTLVGATQRPIFDTAKSLILNLAVGGDFGGDPNGSTVFPQHFDIEYARVWQRENGFFGLVNGGFDESQGSFNDWETFNSTGSNITIATAGATTGSSAVRLASQQDGVSFAGLYQGVAVDGGESLRVRLDSLIPTGEALAAGGVASIKVEYYNQFGAGYQSAAFLGEDQFILADPGSLTAAWRRHEYLVDVPSAAVEARISILLNEGTTSGGALLLDSLSVVSVDGIAGDYNYDGQVDLADYTVWRDALGSTINLAADGNRDGEVNAADYTVWEAALSSSSAAAAVPEPSTLLLTMLALVSSRSSRLAVRS
ncbi:family 16 glycosylhydrolase [Botrimarina hoheduenensis]|uniref:Beta-glucanase n=1 Tax=Botrimarina hoheduenensis TaxID=2528000 RepID=A0A5C5WCH5_9BACT|nr:family 16 glycosylhydrolase [Botrimarina hoheduenensis]TWT48616.1 Beta-glucanase precursor [Botrimarina hoheduenensis]